MSEFTVHNEDTAPAAAQPTLAAAKAAFGAIPNLIGTLSEAPAAAEAYMDLSRLVGETSFSPTERHVVWFTINAENNCTYCMAAHTAIAKGEQIADDVIETARAVGSYDDPKLEALRRFTLAVVRERGWVPEDELTAFYSAGYDRQQVLEVILIAAHKTISNYVNHFAETPLDAPFAGRKWERQGVAS